MIQHLNPLLDLHLRQLDRHLRHDARQALFPHPSEIVLLPALDGSRGGGEDGGVAVDDALFGFELEGGLWKGGNISGMLEKNELGDLWLTLRMTPCSLSLYGIVPPVNMYPASCSILYVCTFAS